MSRKGSSVTTARKRVASVFTYLQELHRVRTPPPSNLKQYAWTLKVKDIPDSPAVRTGSRLDGHLGERPTSGGSDFLLRVGRQSEELFAQLFEIWTQIERESEKYQFYIGDGVLVAPHDEGRVEHPILLSRLDIKFDPRIPAFTITESAEAPEIYATLLRHLAVDGKALFDLQEEFAEDPCDPLDGKEADQFLKKMVHSLWPDGGFGERDQLEGKKEHYIYREPTIYLGQRTHDLADSIDRYLETVSDEKEFSEALLRIVGIDTQRPRTESQGDAFDVLMTHPANPEQVRVIRRLSETGAVLVQGPPGTGKSHTIANLIGHLLAQNKTILVTSHASKALRVVREKVAAPLRSLCVSVLDSDEESAQQLDESINGILNYLSATSQKELEKEIAVLTEERERLRSEEQMFRRKLLESLEMEFGKLEVEGKKESPANLARKLETQQAEHGWIPGQAEGTEPPLSRAELVELYKLATEVDSQAEANAAKAPNIDKLPSPKVFGEHAKKVAKEPRRPSTKRGTEYWRHTNQTLERLEEAKAACTEAADILERAQGWVLECLAAGCQGKEASESWRSLLQMIRRAQKQIPPRRELVVKHGPDVKLDWPLKEALKIANEIVEHLTAGGRLTGMKALFKREWKIFVRGCRVDSGPPETTEHFRAILDLLEIYSMRTQLAKRWDRQMVPYGAPPAAELGRDIENAAAPYAQHMRTTLHWAEHGMAHCDGLFAEIGFDFVKLMRDTKQPAGKHGDLLRLRELFKNRIPDMLAARADFISENEYLLAQSNWLDGLDTVAEDGGPLARELADAIRAGDAESYASYYEKLTELIAKVPALARRNALLERLAARAPEWAQAIRDRTPPHDTGKLPGAGDIQVAWRHRQMAEILKGATSTDLDQLQNELNATSDALMRTTARYVEKLAWLAQIKRTGLDEQQALAGWLGLHKKIGKGSGKNAARLREEAKKTLARCRQAVPVWIMPLSRVIENFDLATTRFDVVILDEASQCDILGLTCFAMAKEVAVVGDHEQVSPYAVGHKIEKIQALIDELLHDIPNKQLYDGKTSVYDLARQSFGGTIRLLEHFRCVPDIIQFSNHLCYGGEIQALREASSAQVKPPLIYHHVAGGVKDDKINEYEAHEIASIVGAICDAEEYADLTIGVICMVGTEQALRIDALLRRRLTAAEYQRRRLLCGNASQFQGDERDIVLLSMVDSPRYDGARLAMKQREDLKKVFNVAASRARDQLWVVHSLDPEKDLKDGDLRLKLLSHARSPDVLRNHALNPYERVPTRFEEELSGALESLGYRTTLHGAVGQYRIDIVVEGRSGARVAVLCDGDRDMNRETLLARVGRHMTLKRLGWPFIRVPASSYYVDPDATLARIQKRLAELRVNRHGTNPSVTTEAPAEDLLARILERVSRSRSQWMSQLRDSGYDPDAIRKRAAQDEQDTDVDESDEPAEIGEDESPTLIT